MKTAKRVIALCMLLSVACLLIGAAEAQQALVFTDPVFEAKMHETYMRNGGWLSVSACKQITSLNLSNLERPQEEWDSFPDSEKIHSLDDLRYFPNLTSLDFGLNAVTDLSPLTELTQLTYLEAPMNQISDLGPIANLTSLRHAVFWNNRIEDLSPLAKLTNLEVLSVSFNRIADIGPLSSLANLTTLELTGNLITDFSPVAAVYENLEVRDFGLPTIPAGQSDGGLSREPSAAADAADYTLAGSIGGETNALAVAGRYAYVGKGATVVALENEGGSLSQVGKQLSLDAAVTDLAMDGDRLYAAAGEAGVYLIDLSEPCAPMIAGRCRTDGYAQAVAVRDGLLYVANGYRGLCVVDVSVPDAPALAGQAYAGAYVCDVALDGSCAYLAAADDGLLIADLTDGREPAELAAYDTDGVARSVLVEGGRAYVADDWQGVCVLDVRKPAEPALAAKVPTAGRAYGLALDGATLYVADAYMGVRVLNIANLDAPVDIDSFVPDYSRMVAVAVRDGCLYCVDQKNGVLLFDAADPAALRLQSLYANAIPLPLTLMDGLQYWDNRIEIERLAVLGVVDAEDIRPDAPVTRAEFASMLCRVLKVTDVPEGTQANFSDVSPGDAAFSDIENVANLGVMGAAEENRFDPGGTMACAEVVACLLRMVHRAPDAAGPDKVMQAAKDLGITAVFCGNDATGPVQRANAIAMLEKVVAEVPDGLTNETLLAGRMGIKLEAFPATVSDIVVKDGVAYAASGSEGLNLIDVGDLACVRLIAHLDFPEAINFVRVNGDYAYALSASSLYAVNVADPSHPFRTGGYMSFEGGPTRGLVVENDKLYIADEWGVKIYSVEDPTIPVLLKQETLMIDEYGYNDCTADIAVRNGIAYLAFAKRGIEIYDLTDVNDIRLIGSCTEGCGGATNIQFVSDLAYVKLSSDTVILDIRDIMHPVRVALVEGTSSTQFNYRVAADGALVLLPMDDDGVWILDVSNPAEPVVAGLVNTPGIPVNAEIWDGCVYVADGVGGICAVDLAKSGVSLGAGAAASDGGEAPAVADFQTGFFRGATVERCVQTGEKALAILAAQRERTDFTQVLTVENTAGEGEGSLAWCLANVPAGGKITFDTSVFPPSEPATIFVKEGILLDFDLENVTIDASDAGVILDGSQATGNCTGIVIFTAGNVIRGLQFQNFSGLGVALFRKSGNIIGGSREIGAGPNGEGNVFIRCGGVSLSGYTVMDNIVAGNNIGIAADGVTPSGNDDGIELREYAARNVIGIDAPGYGNLIGANRNNGVSSMGSAYGNLIEGNTVGTDITGTLNRGNDTNGISFELGGFGSVVRRNIVCGNGCAGILVSDGGSSYNVIVENSFGLGADGVTRIPNEASAISVNGGLGGGSTGNVVGDGDEALQNATVDVPGEHTIEVGMCIFNTMINGVAYRYASVR